MELVIGLLVIGVVGYFVFFRNKEDTVSAAPYKVETPVPAADVAPQPAVAVEGAGVVEVVTTPVAEEAPAKKPRKPRAPKVGETAAKSAKAADKKAAPKKAAAIKATKKSKKA